MITKFEVGKYYRYTGTTRLETWNSEGAMDGALDGLPHLCTEIGVCSHGLRARLLGVGEGNWYWSKESLENWEDCENASTSTATPEQCFCNRVIREGNCKFKNKCDETCPLFKTEYDCFKLGELAMAKKYLEDHPMEGCADIEIEELIPHRIRAIPNPFWGSITATSIRDGHTLFSEMVSGDWEGCI